MSRSSGSDPFEENAETQEKDPVAEVKQRAGILTKNDVEKTQAETGEVQMLVIRIQELELANNKAKLQMKRLRKQLREKEKTRGQEQVAMRGLEIMKRNQLLEQKVRNVERTMLCNFFEATEPKPNQMIAEIIDKALSYAIDVLLMRPDLFDDFVDNELRLFLLDNQKAKHILLDVMLSHPEYVPRAWGGDTLTRRQREEQMKEDRKPSDMAEDRTVVDEETLRILDRKKNHEEEDKKSTTPDLKSPATTTTPDLKTPTESTGKEKLPETKKSEKTTGSAEKDGKKAEAKPEKTTGSAEKERKKEEPKVQKSPAKSEGKEKIVTPKKSKVSPKKSKILVQATAKKSDSEGKPLIKKAENKSVEIRRKSSESSAKKRAAPVAVRRISTAAPLLTQNQAKQIQDDQKKCKML
ncbi:hypothetical protein OESDEN_12603 [Oesophagostomum dentatum]|uniref:DUF7774 domain-containing protein n=2 Tax=Oesophagostomum dentatum TaxID=61180 RepID=A0A0B1SUS0_OESDE|nr:hypothetical protein OESDEN_12603 [Oesophagostomum dentatum]